MKLTWYDILPCDQRIESVSASTPRYVLRALVGEQCDAAEAENRYFECRNCGRQVENGTTCPACGSDEIAEYEQF